MLLRRSRWVICEKKKVRRRQQTIQSDETYELPPPLSSVMEKGGHCRQVMRRGAHGQRGVDVAALLLLLLAERHLLGRYSKSQEFSLSLRYSSYLCSTALLLRCIVSIVGMAGAGHPPCLMIAGETEKCPQSNSKTTIAQTREAFYAFTRVEHDESTSGDFWIERRVCVCSPVGLRYV